MLLIDQDGTKLGKMNTKEALEIAQERDLDLVEVAPKGKPPVAKLISWSKFKYIQTKKKKESKQKATEQKEMWFKAFIGEGDLKHKLKKVKEFIDKKHKVKLTVRGKGRVKRDHLKNLLEDILLKVEEYAEAEGTVKNQGRNLSIIIKPRKTKLTNSENEEDKEKNT